MQLKQLKLSGFKSFVDPTVIPFPSHLVAVLGPNGCGKSNIIDAVRWVLGESSAKNLRGEAMADVIFNGSSGRKPVGQAQVELIFDNRLGRIGGEYARFHEISIKRVVTREGDSAYYLNGTKCRRRDITDLFLGTGAGAQGYSIIGQGTVSKIIEAKPDELRAYFEEAAGISKYKERRRETLSRMQTTREHLERLADIRLELEKQLERLSRQANTARRYQSLKNEERQTKIGVHALRWQTLNQDIAQKAQDLNALVLEEIAGETQQTTLFETITQKRLAYHEANDGLQLLQDEYYKLGTEMARVEQQLVATQKDQLRQQQEVQRLKNALQSAIEKQKQAQEAQASHQACVAQAKATFEAHAATFNAQQSALEDQAACLRETETNLQNAQALLSTTEREYALTKLQLQHKETQRQTLMLKAEALDDAQYEDGLEEILMALSQYTQDKATLSAHLQTLEAELSAQNTKRLEVQAECQALLQKNHENALQQTQIKSDYEALKAAQAKLFEMDTSLWPKALQEAPELYAHLVVDPKWQKACELVLGVGLSGRIVPDFEAAKSYLTQTLTPMVLCLGVQATDSNLKHERLSDYVQGLRPQFAVALESIYVANTLSEAFLIQEGLPAGASVITPEGVWMGANFLICPQVPTDLQDGVLLRQDKIKSLQTQLQDLVQQAQVISQAQITQYAQKEQIEKTYQALSQEKQEGQTKLKQVELTIQARERQLQAFKLEQEKQALEKQTLQDHLEVLAEALAQEALALAQQFSLLETQEAQTQVLKSARDALTTEGLAKAQALEASRRLMHESEMQWSRLAQSLLMQQEAIETEKRNQEVLNESLEALQSQQAHQQDIDALERCLKDCVSAHQALEIKLNGQRAHIQSEEAQLQEAERLQRESEQGLKSTQLQVQAHKTDIEVLKLRAQVEQEALLALGASFEMLNDRQAAVAPLEEQEALLLQISDKIKRLGPINLVAIEEYDTEALRKNELDAQNDDLNKALSALETAIAQMDKETHQRLKQTFDEVNTAFGQLFPRLFGGGRAQLMLTCDNLLEAGVVVMAQPPGKRNSTIQLLSGGEKAMTAVALIFAIFQLNPSPFCMLDEVDAPLDDANVGRFCDLVKEMSQVVQFLFITHNKVTMALADHLIGVTMREPGVSRVVAVDIEQALSLAE